jgi:glycosyltransferase involved in cell wall biosynthesis
VNFLFVHQNFPGQFRHAAKALAENGHQVVGLGDVANLRGRPSALQGVQIYGYTVHATGQARTHHYVRDFEGAVRRGQSVARAILKLKESGFQPDVVVVHPGWGEALFLRDVLPQARHVNYCEFFYSGTGADVGFDPEFPASLDDRLKVRIKNATQLLGLVTMDRGIAPTRWQAGRYPGEFQHKIEVIHEGIDTELARPDPEAVVEIGELKLSRHDEVVTYVARNLEPYRGFHIFMRALPRLLKLRPKAHVVIVGADQVSYGKRLPEGRTWRETCCAELKDDIDWKRVHFAGSLPYRDYLKVLQVSSAHVYLTYPFVLSWSMLEAMSAGCALVASRTQPVAELVVDGVNGRLVDFFDAEAIAQTAHEMIETRRDSEAMRNAARETVVQGYDLRNVCLPKLMKFLQQDDLSMSARKGDSAADR